MFVKDKAGQLLEERYKVYRMICKLILQVGRRVGLDCGHRSA